MFVFYQSRKRANRACFTSLLDLSPLSSVYFRDINASQHGKTVRKRRKV